LNPNLSDPASWRASYAVGGSPGVDENYAHVAGRRTFYNFSSYDGNDAAASAADDGAIATDKQALLPGETASFTNYTSYSQGLNGIMVDLLYFTGTINVSDFVFRVGNDEDPPAWVTAPEPIMLLNRSMPGGVTRVYIVWDNNAIQNQWLQVTLKGGETSASGLQADDVFYFGNAIGEVGNSPSNAQVNAVDEIVTRFNAGDLSGLPTAQAIVNAYDFNRDKVVDAADEEIVGTHYTFFLNGLKLISVPEAAPLVMPMVAAPGAVNTVVPAAEEPAAGERVPALKVATAPVLPVATVSTTAAASTVNGDVKVKVVSQASNSPKHSTRTKEAAQTTRALKGAARGAWAGWRKSAWRGLFGK
jgi:hypothetical protein